MYGLPLGPEGLRAEHEARSERLRRSYGAPRQRRSRDHTGPVRAGARRLARAVSGAVRVEAHDTVRPETAVARPETTVARPETTVARPETTVARPETTVARPETTTARPGHPERVRPVGGSARTAPAPTGTRSGGARHDDHGTTGGGRAAAE